MAEEVFTTPTVGSAAVTVGDEPLPTKQRISWGAIFGGAFSALGLWLLLYTFGVAIGLSSVDPNSPGSIRGSGLFTGIWSALAPLLAMFVGGLVAGRLAGGLGRGFGALHGLVMWGLVSVAGVYLVMSLLGSVIAGVGAVGKTVAEAGGEAVKGVTGVVVGGAEQLGKMGIDWKDALGPINQRLNAAGKPAMSAEEMQAATKDAVQSSMRAGRFDRATFENALSQNTALSKADAQELSHRVQAQFDEFENHAKERARSVVDEARTGALKAADAAGKSLWGVFGALLLGLIAAILGGALGVPRRHVRERTARESRTTTIEQPPRSPILPPREAYPRG